MTASELDRMADIERDAVAKMGMSRERDRLEDMARDLEVKAIDKAREEARKA